MTPQIRVVAALIESPQKDGSYLVQQRLADKARANLWEFPGGKVEPGETDETALRRECFEELGVDLVIGARVWSKTHQYQDVRVHLELFAAHIATGTPQALGAQAIRFCTPTEMQKLPFCEADVDLIAALTANRISL